MQVSRELDSPIEVTLNVSMDAEDEEPFLNRSYRRLAGRIRIPGFRPGKAPRSVVESHLGRATLIQEALEFMIPESLDKILRDHEIHAFAQPQLEVLDLEPVSFKAVVPLEPQVDLGDIHSIRVESPPVEVGEEDVNKVLEELRFESAPWEPAERPTAFGDLVTINVNSTIDGEDAFTGDGVDFVPQLENDYPLPGFSVYLEGMNEGQDKDFTLTFPDDYAQSEMAGKECRFHVEVVAVKEKKLPDLDDEFAKGVREGFESLDALSEHVRQRLTEESEANAQRELERSALEELLKIASVEASELVYLREMETIREERERSLANSRLDLATYLRATGQTAEDWDEQLRPQAEERLSTFLVIRKLADQEGLEVESGEVDSEIDRLVENTEEDRVDNIRAILNSDDSREGIRSSLLNRKVMSHLVQIATAGDKAEGEDAAEDTAAAASVDDSETTPAAANATEDDGAEDDGAGSGEQSNE